MSDAREVRDLTAAATVHASKEEVVRALGPLAARPLDEHAAGQMRRALARASSAEVRAALRHLEASTAARRRSLRSVPAPGAVGDDEVTDDPIADYSNVVALRGGAA